MKTLSLIIALVCSTAAYAGGIAEEMDVAPVVTGETDCSTEGDNRPITVPVDGDQEVTFLPSTVNWCITPPERNPLFETTHHGG